ncbi:hypothetical protein R5R35_000012 [Gryllus longicercus]|uniref:C2 domain-containing protein n=1 Tax=Gryllus longicercus TaxID=2509291 RepID=A0AAN9Z4C8_9ORTH
MESTARAERGGAAAMSVAAVATLRGLLRKARLAAGGGGGGGGNGGSGAAPAALEAAGAARPVDDDSAEPVPAVGFRARLQQGGKLQVTVLGARHLPQRLPGLGAPAAAYVVKVKLSPGAAKFETEPQAASWPTFNESFTFSAAPAASAGRFLMLTVYAADELRRRKALGAVTWSLDTPQGQQALAAGTDIWRRLHDVRSAVQPTTPQQQQLKQRETRRSQVEVSLRLAPGAAGEPDVLEMTLLRLRWSLQAAREHEQKKAQLFVKLSVREGAGGAVVVARRTKPFAPNIAVHFGAGAGGEEAAVVRAPLPPAGPRRAALLCQVALCTRNGPIGKKVVLGRASFGASEGGASAGAGAGGAEGDGDGEGEGATSHVTRALQSPGRTLTHWHPLL